MTREKMKKWLANLYSIWTHRAAQYRLNYVQYGKVFSALSGHSLKNSAAIGIFHQMLSKITRISELFPLDEDNAQHNLNDTLDDIAVYAMLLKDIASHKNLEDLSSEWEKDFSNRTEKREQAHWNEGSLV